MFDAYSVSEVALKLPLEISSISCQKSSHSLYAGSKDGHLFVYSPLKNNRRGFELATLCKKFERRAVLGMTICEDEELLICVSDGQLASHRLTDSHFSTIEILHKIKPVHSFLAWRPQGHASLYILVSSKKRLYLLKWANNDFVDVKFEYNMSFPDTPTCMRNCGDTIAFSVRNDYYVMNLTETMSTDEDERCWTGEVRRLFSTTDTPSIATIDDKEMFAFSCGDTVVMCNPDKTKSPRCPDVKFSDAPLNILYDTPYLVAILSKGRIEVRSLHPTVLMQSIVLSKSQFICLGNPGHIYVSSPSDVWLLDVGPHLRKVVASLIAEKQFDVAIQVANTSKTFTEEEKIEIKRQSAINLFNQKKFDESFALHQEIKSDVIAIIQLFPELLPEKYQQNAQTVEFAANDRKRALLALGNYLSAARSEYAKKLDQNQRAKSTGQPTLSQEEYQKLQVGLQIMDTTLLKCYLKTKPMLVDSLLRLHNNTCYFEDAQTILKRENRLSSLFILYETRKKHEMALELLHEQSLNPDAEPFFQGTFRTVEYLQSLGNTHLELVFKYAKWVLAKDLDEGLSIFIGEESDVARNLDRERILNFFVENCVPAVIPYLEHIIYKWEETQAHFHESLVEHYVMKVKMLMDDYVHAFPDDENLVPAGQEEGDLGMYRRSLLRFLRFSLQYSPQSILLQLSKYPLYEERALILGRLKHHEQALTIYTSILNDFDSAEKYCQHYYDKTDPINSQVYMQWLRAYVCPADPLIAGLSERDVPMEPTTDVHSAIKVLSRHADRIDTVAALSLLPSDTPLSVLFQALNAVLQTVHDDATACALRRSVCSAAVERSELRLRQAESTKIVLSNATDCVKCGKKIGNSAFVRFPADGSLAHFYCYD